MEIGPVTGVRAVGFLRGRRTPDAGQPALVIDPSAHTADERYSSGSQTPDRCLEDETEDNSCVPPVPKGKQISLFA